MIRIDNDGMDVYQDMAIPSDKDWAKYHFAIIKFRLVCGVYALQDSVVTAVSFHVSIPV